MKKSIYQFIQHLAASVFIGLSVYGFIIFMGGEVNKHIPFWTSLMLGFAAVLCVVVVVFMGGVIDKMTVEQIAQEDLQE